MVNRDYNQNHMRMYLEQHWELPTINDLRIANVQSLWQYGKMGPALLSFMFHSYQQQWFERQFDAAVSIEAFDLYEDLKRALDLGKTEMVVLHYMNVKPFCTPAGTTIPHSAGAPREKHPPLGDVTQNSVRNPNVDPRFTVNNKLRKNIKKQKISG